MQRSVFRKFWEFVKFGNAYPSKTNSSFNGSTVFQFELTNIKIVPEGRTWGRESQSKNIKDQNLLQKSLKTYFIAAFATMAFKLSILIFSFSNGVIVGSKITSSRFFSRKLNDLIFPTTIEKGWAFKKWRQEKGWNAKISYPCTSSPSPFPTISKSHF